MILKSEIKKALQRYIDKNRLEKQEVAQKIGTTATTVGRWLKSDSPKHIDDTVGIRLLELLQCNHELPQEYPEKQRNYIGSFMTYVYGLAQADSVFQSYGDVVPESENALDSVTIPKSLRGYKNIAAFEVTGDSMEPSLPDGVYAFIAPEEPLHQGDIALVKYDDQVVCKRIIQNDSVILYSDNADYPPITIAKADIQWAYKVVGKLQSEKFNDGEH